MAAKLHARSNSLPSTSATVEEELCLLRIHLSSPGRTAKLMHDGVRCAATLYELIEDLLRRPSNQRNCSLRQKKWAEEQLECSHKLLDIISSVRECLFAMIEHVQDFRSAIQKKGQEVTVSSKKVNKSIKDSHKAVGQLAGKDQLCVGCTRS